MVFFAPLFSAAVLLSGFASALPRPQDSALGEEVAVSAPNGIPLTDGVELSSQLASETAVANKAQMTEAAGNYGAGAYGSGGYGASSDNQWTSEAVVTASTSAAWPAYSSPAYSPPTYSSPVYGSGNSNWGGSGYNDCVSQCLATYGGPMAPYIPTPTSGSSEGSSGSGATHTVIVAPSQGVLRYVPFAVNASVGDTVKFMWGANNHTVTKSSALQPCNKSSDATFASGIQIKDFVFTQVVNDTNPVYFHCAVPGHCQKGMFGIINPPNAFGSASSVSGMMQTLGASNPDVAAYASYTTSQTGSNLQASKWGGNIDLAAIPDWAQAVTTENVLYTRNFLAANSEVLKSDGSIDLSSAGSTPLMIPQDVSAALNNAAAPNAPVPSSPSPSDTSAAPTQTNESENQVQGNGASSLASPRAFVALFVVVATFFAL
jgi:plastocyanin